MTSLHLHDTEFQLHPEKALYWPEQDILLLADLHLGKITHFRASGIPAPEKPNDVNIESLILLLQKVKPGRVIFMGDLFHSYYNPEWEVFGNVLKYFPQISFDLVVGNHDILSAYQYHKHELRQYHEPLVIDGFILTHEPLDEAPEGLYNLAGHIHPGVRLRGKGRQGITLPCFYFSDSMGLLPAFGAFTGLHRIRPGRRDRVFVILENKVMAMS